MNCNFSYAHYNEILDNFKEQGYSFGSFDVNPKGKTVWLRHDLDHSIIKALHMADVERAANAKATYCLRLASPFDNLFYKENIDAIQKIVDRGHDLALHYERESWGGDMSEETILGQIEYLKKYFPVKKIVSFHRPQDDLFNQGFYGFINTYDQQFFGDVVYLSDSTGHWRSGCPCTHLKEIDEGKNFQLLTHPVWWGREDGDSCEHLHNFMREKIKEWDQIYYDDNPFYIKRLK